jgi:hypothetical protein
MAPYSSASLAGAIAYPLFLPPLFAGDRRLRRVPTVRGYSTREQEMTNTNIDELLFGVIGANTQRTPP